VRFLVALMCGPSTFIIIPTFLRMFSNLYHGSDSYGPKTFKKEVLASCIVKKVFETFAPIL
jgi:hypothetical protein